MSDISKAAIEAAAEAARGHIYFPQRMECECGYPTGFVGHRRHLVELVLAAAALPVVAAEQGEHVHAFGGREQDFECECGVSKPLRNRQVAHPPFDRDKAVEELTEAIRFTVEYTGNDTLPAVSGWSWFDALMKYAPEKARVFADNPIYFPANAERADRDEEIARLEAVIAAKESEAAARFTQAKQEGYAAADEARRVAEATRNRIADAIANDDDWFDPTNLAHHLPYYREGIKDMRERAESIARADTQPTDGDER